MDKIEINFTVTIVFVAVFLVAAMSSDRPQSKDNPPETRRNSIINLVDDVESSGTIPPPVGNTTVSHSSHTSSVARSSDQEHIRVLIPSIRSIEENSTYGIFHGIDVE